MKSRKHQIKMKYKRISRPVLCLIAVILAGGMLRGMAPVSALAAPVSYTHLTLPTKA